MDDGGRGVDDWMGRGEDGWGGVDDSMVGGEDRSVREDWAGECDGFSLGDGDGGRGEKLWGS